MSKKKPPKGGIQYSKLSKLKRRGKSVKSTFSEIEGLRTSSWSDECIPNILWACILVSELSRETYLDLFRTVIRNAKEAEIKESVSVTHYHLSKLTDEEFDLIFEDVLKNDDSRGHLSSITLLGSLPDNHHWRRHLESPSSKEGWDTLANAVAATFDHQSQGSTDIRWMKLVYTMVVGDKIRFGIDQSEFIEQLRLYPNEGDMRQVRPKIRAMEMGIRSIETGDEVEQKEKPAIPPFDPEKFWAETVQKTPCVMAINKTDSEKNLDELHKEIAALYTEIVEHFHNTNETTAPHPRHDAAFGLTLYALSMLLGSIFSRLHQRAEGRIVIRSIVEAFITLHFLLHNDDEQLWMKYRNFGNGQAKLAFLKNVDEESIPDFLDIELLEQLANEDMWLEFVDIDLGNWADLNLRKMAEMAGVKDVYDRFYDWTSGFSHGHWISVRDSVFTNCLNPLHRFHRVPGLPRADMSSTLSDACRLLNRMLDDLNTLYPSFKPRLGWHKKQQESRSTSEVDSDN